MRLPQDGFGQGKDLPGNAVTMLKFHRFSWQTRPKEASAPVSGAQGRRSRRLRYVAHDCHGLTTNNAIRSTRSTSNPTRFPSTGSPSMMTMRSSTDTSWGSKGRSGPLSFSA